MDELEHFLNPKEDAKNKVNELNKLAGYNRFTVIATAIPGNAQGKLKDSYTIKDNKTGKTYVYGSFTGSIGLSALAKELKKTQVDAISAASTNRKGGSFRHNDTSNNDNYLEHYGVLGMKWGVRRYQPYTNGKKGTFIGPKAKYTKEENKTRKELVRKVTAAQRNLVDKEKIRGQKEEEYAKAQEQERKARAKTVFPWNRQKKRQEVADAEEYVQKALKDLEIPRADAERAEQYCDKQIKALKDFAKSMNDKYGAENINQLKTKKKASYYAGNDYIIKYVNDFIKTGVNMANIPAIGNWVSAKYVMEWETADRDALSKSRADNLRKNRY